MAEDLSAPLGRKATKPAGRGLHLDLKPDGLDAGADAAVGAGDDRLLRVDAVGLWCVRHSQPLLPVKPDIRVRATHLSVDNACGKRPRLWMTG